MFSPETFFSTAITEANDTRFPNVPEGEYTAVLDKVEARQHDKDGKTSTILDVTWSIDDEGAKAATGLARPTVRQSIFLDMTPNGGLDMSPGKNVKLGKLREALGMNTPGKPWAPSMLIGSVARVLVRHKDEYANIAAVSKL